MPMTAEQRKASSDRMKAMHEAKKAEKAGGVAVLDPVALSEPSGEDFIEFDEFQHQKDTDAFDYIQFDNTDLVRKEDPGQLRSLLQAGWVKVAESTVVPQLFLLKISKERHRAILKQAEERYDRNLGRIDPGNDGAFTGKVEKEASLSFEELVKSSAQSVGADS